MINVILLENQVLIRKAIKTLLENEPDIKISGEADDGAQLLDLIKRDVGAYIVLAEMSNPDTADQDLIQNILTLSPESKLAFLTGDASEKKIMQAMTVGARGYLNITININELLFAIRHIHNDGHYICSFSSMALLKKMQQSNDTKPVEISGHTEFTAREIEVLNLMGEGFTNYEIAERLFTSKRAIENNRQHMLNKTGSRNTAALIKYALQYGVIKL